MSAGPDERPGIRPPSRLFALWHAYRQIILWALTALGLAAVLAWLPAEMRRALLGGLLARRVLLALILIFGLLMLSLLWSEGQRMDLAVFTWMNLRGSRPTWLDRFMFMATQFGNGVVALLLAGFFYFSDERRAGVELALGLLTLWLVVETVKVLTARVRPSTAVAAARVIGWRERGRSFPSGHTSQAFFMAGLLAHHFHFGPLGSTLLYLAAAIVGLTRMYVGAHYPRDVLGGALLGSVWAILMVIVDGSWGQ